MTTLPPVGLPPRPPRPVPHRGRGRIVLRIGLWILAVGAAFAVGLALGEALHDNPKPGGTHTDVRTLRPRPLPPVRRSVTASHR